MGFDLRLVGGSEWIESQRLTARVNVVSGDPAVWRRPSAVERRLSGQLGLLDNPLTLAKDVDELVETFRINAEAKVDTVKVAMTCDEAIFDHLARKWGPGYFDRTVTAAALRKRGWNLAGFDVVDLNGLISGLSGCGYTSADKQSLVRHYGKSFNANGLFSSAGTAGAFACVRGLQVPAHAPFVPLGIWVLS